MSNKDDFDWGARDELGKMIGLKAYSDPDPALTGRIMGGLRPKHRGWFKTFCMHMFTPRRLSLSPVMASAAAVFLILSGGLLFNTGIFDQAADAPVIVPATHQVPVVFRLRAADAQSVAVIGSFNRWNPKGHEMVLDPETGDWTIRVNLSPGKHDYVFLVDGQQITSDPNADICKADEYGHQNSILFVKGPNGQKI